MISNLDSIWIQDVFDRFKKNKGTGGRLSLFLEINKAAI